MESGLRAVVELTYSGAAARTYTVEFVNIEYGSCIDNLLSSSTLRVLYMLVNIQVLQLLL